MSKNEFKNLKIALIADEITGPCLAHECKVWHITPGNYKFVLTVWRPDVLLVESVWNGYKRKWRRKVVSIPDVESNELKKVVEYAQYVNIPTVFWNKEDGFHFQRFIDKAKLFEHIFTSDINVIPEYRKHVSSATTVTPLMFAVQPKFHKPDPSIVRKSEFCFVGSYTRDMHPERLKYQNLLFYAAENFGLVMYDRNSYIQLENYRLPPEFKITIKPRVSHEETGDIFRRYHAYLNVNTITDSPTMFSRRLIEIMACAAPVISNPSTSINKYFKDYVHTASNEEEARDLFARLAKPYDTKIKAQLAGGAQYILENHTYKHRLREIFEVIK